MPLENKEKANKKDAAKGAQLCAKALKHQRDTLLLIDK